MDQKTPTNFIPRSSSVDDTLPPRAPAGVFTIAAVIIFLLVAFGTVGLYAYKYTLEKKSAKLSIELEKYRLRVHNDDVGVILKVSLVRMLLFLMFLMI